MSWDLSPRGSASAIRSPTLNRFTPAKGKLSFGTHCGKLEKILVPVFFFFKQKSLEKAGPNFVTACLLQCWQSGLMGPPEKAGDC